MTYHVMHILKDEKNLRLFLNSKKQIFLEIQDDENGPELAGYICLDKQESTDLANELLRIVKEEME